jgi:hypothetical protein
VLASLSKIFFPASFGEWWRRRRLQTFCKAVKAQGETEARPMGSGTRESREIGRGRRQPLPLPSMVYPKTTSSTTAASSRQPVGELQRRWGKWGVSGRQEKISRGISRFYTDRWNRSRVHRGCSPLAAMGGCAGRHRALSAGKHTEVSVASSFGRKSVGFRGVGVGLGRGWVATMPLGAGQSGCRVGGDVPCR